MWYESLFPTFDKRLYLESANSNNSYESDNLVIGSTKHPLKFYFFKALRVKKETKMSFRIITL